MSLVLSPFPEYHHPPERNLVSLPLTRNGVHRLPTGTLTKSRGPCFAELQMRATLAGKPSRGICGLIPAAAFLDGRIRPHEGTLAARLQRQEDLVRMDRGALGKPVLLTARNISSVTAMLDDHYLPQENTLHFAGYETEYYLSSYLPKNEAAPPIDLSGLGTIVIADGHHRAETHARLAAAGVLSCREVPVCIVDAAQLTIGIFLRQVAAYEKPVGTLLYGLSPFFEVQRISEPRIPATPDTWLMTYRGEYYELTRRTPQRDYPTPSGWFVGEVLKSLFGIENPSTDPELEHVPVDKLPGGVLDIKDKELLSFAGCPVSPELFFSEVEAGRTLPPKSTRFIPRVPSGLLVWKGCVG